MKFVSHNLEHLHHLLTEGLLFNSCTYEGLYFISTVCTFQKKGNLLDFVLFFKENFTLWIHINMRCTKIKGFQGDLGVF